MLRQRPRGRTLHRAISPKPPRDAHFDTASIVEIENRGFFNGLLEVPLREPESGSNVPKQFRPPPNRYVQFTLQSGETTTVETNLQPKGREFAGAAP